MFCAAPRGSGSVVRRWAVGTAQFQAAAWNAPSRANREWHPVERALARPSIQDAISQGIGVTLLAPRELRNFIVIIKSVEFSYQSSIGDVRLRDRSGVVATQNRFKTVPWKPGQSGNPGGRPRGVGEVRDLAREQTGTAIATLTDICRNGKSESARVSAAEALLNRGWGRAMTTADLTLTTAPKSEHDYTDEELMAIVAAGRRGESVALDEDLLLECQ